MAIKEECSEMMESKSEGRKRSQTASDWAAEQKVLETRESLHASTGVVRDRMLAMHPSGKAWRSIMPLVLPCPLVSVSMSTGVGESIGRRGAWRFVARATLAACFCSCLVPCLPVFKVVRVWLIPWSLLTRDAALTRVEVLTIQLRNLPSEFIKLLCLQI